MSFLTDENLTFHRFSDGTISFDSMRKKSSIVGPLEVTTYVDNVIPSKEKKPRLILREYSDASNYAHLAAGMQPNNPNAMSSPSFNKGVWTTRTSESLNSYTNAAALTLTDESSNDFIYLSGTAGGEIRPSASGSSGLANGSTMKLINTTSMEMYQDDQSTKQVSVYFIIFFLNFSILISVYVKLRDTIVFRCGNQ